MFPPAPDSTRKLLSAPTACDKEAKMVPFGTGVVLYVPAVLVMLPLAGMFAPLVALTCMPEMSNVSSLAPPTEVTVIVIVIVESLVTAAEAAVMLPFRARVVVTAAPVLNFQPIGDEIIIVSLAPVVKVPAPSISETVPSVVYADDVALAALSAEMFVPPVAGVTVTCPHAVKPARTINTSVVEIAVVNFFMSDLSKGDLVFSNWLEKLENDGTACCRPAKLFSVDRMRDVNAIPHL